MSCPRFGNTIIRVFLSDNRKITCILFDSKKHPPAKMMEGGCFSQMSYYAASMFSRIFLMLI